MSLVGTRPPTVDEWDKYELHHRAGTYRNVAGKRTKQHHRLRRSRKTR